MEQPTPILYQNGDKTVVLLDLPRSIEEAQTLPGRDLGHEMKTRYLISCRPPTSPFPTPEPKNPGLPQSVGSSSSALVADLMTLGAAESALEVIRDAYDGPWCLPRHFPSRPSLSLGSGLETDGTGQGPGTLSQKTVDMPDLSEYIIPENSHPLLGSIEARRETFLSTAPSGKFDLILLDPPWPNRSAKRKRRGGRSGSGSGSYQPVADFQSIRDLLSLVPVASHLSPSGLVAVWVTNSPKSADLLTAARGGIFEEWQVELVGEWTWLKVTSNGEPIVDLLSTWRKPWERLLIARRRDGLKKLEPVGSKVIVTVPDLHSRKPSLRGLFDDLLPDGYQALEIFARNLTAGWWSWGDQALLFQHRDHWIESNPVAEKSPGRA